MEKWALKHLALFMEGFFFFLKTYVKHLKIYLGHGSTQKTKTCILVSFQINHGFRGAL